MKICIIIERGKGRGMRVFHKVLFIGIMTRQTVKLNSICLSQTEMSVLGQNFTIIWISDSYKDWESITDIKPGGKQLLIQVSVLEAVFCILCN